MVIFRGGEIWFKTGILNSGLIFMGLFFCLCGLFRSEFGGERCFRSWLVVWGCLFKGLVERWFWDWWWWYLGDEWVEVLCNFSDFGSFWVFLNCLTIYCIWWLRDILGVCRSRCRSGLLNCVGIWNNFEVVGMVEVWCFGSEDSGCWILWLTCEWNASTVFGSGRIKSKCKTTPS